MPWPSRETSSHLPNLCLNALGKHVSYQAHIATLGGLATPLKRQSAQEREKGGFKAEVEEEFEDTDGNVYSKKTFEDLRRQGLI